MSKVSRLVRAGYANGERKLKLRWERAKLAKGQDRLTLNRVIKPVSAAVTKPADRVLPVKGTIHFEPTQ